jgi:hypothetical protein
MSATITLYNKNNKNNVLCSNRKTKTERSNRPEYQRNAGEVNLHEKSALGINIAIPKPL